MTFFASYAKTMAGAKRIEQATAKPKPVIPRVKKEEPSPEETRDHILNAFRKRGMPVWARDIVEEVSNRTGVSLELIAGDRKFHRVVHARNEAIYLVKDRNKMLSSPILAKWFARDHTSCLHSIASHSERTGAPSLVGYDLARTRKKNAAFSAWKRKQAQARAGA